MIGMNEMLRVASSDKWDDPEHVAWLAEFGATLQRRDPNRELDEDFAREVAMIINVPRWCVGSADDADRLNHYAVAMLTAAGMRGLFATGRSSELLRACFDEGRWHEWYVCTRRLFGCPAVPIKWRRNGQLPPVAAERL